MSASFESSEGVAAPAVELPVVRLALRRPPFWSARFTILFVLLLVATAGYYAALLPSPSGVSARSLLQLLVPAAACGLAALARAWLRPRSVPPLTFHVDHLVAPRGPESSRALRIDYAEVLAVDLRGHGRAEQLFIGTRRRILSFARPAFVAPEALEGALKELYLRILRLPQGAGIVEQIARRRKLALATMSQPATATSTILAAALLLFALEWIAGALEEPLGAIRFGAATPVLVRAGEVYRLLSSAFLHASFAHLYFDALAFFFLGALLERMLGRARFLLVYLVAALGGAVAALLAGDRLFTTNASAGTFGLLGAYVVVSLRFASDLPLPLRQPLRWWAALAALNSAIPLFAHEVEPASLAAGFVLGVLVSLLVIDGRDALDPAVVPRLGLRFTAGLLATMYAAAFVTGLGRALRVDSDVTQRFAAGVLADPDVAPSALRELAWRVVRSPRPSAEELGWAVQASARAVALRPGEAAHLDAWAAARFRSGSLDDAIAAGRTALRLQPTGHYAEHLARYLRESFEKRGATGLGGARVAGVSLELDVAPAGDAAARLVLPEEAPSGLTLLALALRDGDTVGLLRLHLPPSAAGAHRLPAGDEVWPPRVRWVVVLVEPACGGCVAPSESLSVWNLEAKVGDLP